MDLIVWARNKATVHRMDFWTRAKSNESCLLKNLFEANGDLFFCKTGHVVTVSLERRSTATSPWYTTICLPKVFEEIRKTNKRRRIIVHHGNANSHISAQTSAFLTSRNVELMRHPPYSPDLTPNDFFLLQHIKKKMCSQRFSSPEYAVEAFQNHVLVVFQSE